MFDDPREEVGDFQSELPRDYQKLEFDKVRERLAEHASCELGREEALNLMPSRDTDEIRRWQRLTTEARNMYETADRVPLGGLHDIRRVVQRAQKHAVLRPAELLEVWDTVRAGERLRRYIRQRSADRPDAYAALLELGNQVGEFPDLVQHIERCVAETGEVRDNATSKLRGLRQQISGLKGNIKETLQGYLRSSSQYLQDPIITLRQNRYVLPVRQEYKDQMPGVVHDQSASGATLFIEPMQVVRLNNRLREAELAEEEEVERILAELSAHVASVADKLAWTLEILARLDFAFAKGRYSSALDATEPELNDHGWLDLKQARHPLLGSDVVPIDVRLGKDFRSLVITGPNTGGKTVTLKTVGLLTLMAQAGLHLPCDPVSTQAVFHGVFCDIGDEQSIEQNLSTFSSHMTNIVRIINRAGSRSLVLLDEIGAGTDPVEGSALAMALLEHLYDLGCRTVATTHYSQLKLFAYNHDGIENASVEFDASTLQPTYKLMIGVPGRSNAIEISERLGLQAAVAERARTWISSEQLNVENIIKRMEEDQQRLASERTEAERARSAASRLHQQAADVLGDARSERERILEEARQQARDLLRDSRYEAERLIQELRDLVKKQEEFERHEWANVVQPDLSEGRREAYRGIEEVRREFNELRSEIESQEPEEPQRPVPDVSLGARVNVRSLRKEGVVLELDDDNAVVQLGIMRVTVPISDLEPVDERHEEQQVMKQNVQRLAAGKAETFSPEVHLRGMTVDEALYRLDKYLDDAFLAGQKQVRIVHGKGTGTLRSAVHDYLSGHRNVKSFHLADRYEGGYGVTIANLRTT